MILDDLGKAAHGLNFGWYQRIGTNPRIAITTHGGDYRRLVPGLKPRGDHLVKFGNNWGSDWIDHKKIVHNNWHFWDNPEIPHFLYPGPHNPKGKKVWVRWCRNDIFSTPENTTVGHADRINYYLTEEAGQKFTWEELVQPKPVRAKNSKRILICPSSANCYTYYYGLDQKTWIKRCIKMVESRGYEAVVRYKPGRTARTEQEDLRLVNSLDQFAATVSQHSASAVESIGAGTPAIVTGPHPAGPLATTREQFLSGEFNLPTDDQVYQWFELLLSNTRHKVELFTGIWQT